MRPGNRGFTLSETFDAQAIYKWVLEWSDLMSFDVSVVLHDEEFAKALGG